MHYLIGNGKKLKIDNDSWKKYMLNSKMCSCPNHEKYDSNITLKTYITRYVLKRKNKIGSKVFSKKKFTTAAAIQNGESIIGRNYLHGTNKKAGGLKLEVGVILKNNIKYYDVKVTWNDIIDPNFIYSSDLKKYAIANSLPLINPTSYTICITWKFSIKIP